LDFALLVRPSADRVWIAGAYQYGDHWRGGNIDVWTPAVAIRSIESLPPGTYQGRLAGVAADHEKSRIESRLPGVLVLFADGQRRAYFLGAHAWEYVTLQEPRESGGPPNDELQRTSDGNAAGSPLNSVLDGPTGGATMTRLAGVALFVAVSGLEGAPRVMEGPQRETIVAAIEERIRESAERDLDPERALAHFASVPEFHIYNDGRLLTYDQVAAAVRGGFPKVRSMETPFSNLRVSVLGPEYVLVTATLRRTVVDNTGTVTRTQGAATWVWRKIDGHWLIVYGQLDHRPDTGA
jgi:hypothetical protein